MTKLTGLIAAPHTPFDANGEVNYPVIDRIAEHLIAQGVKGAYVCGTTGEGIHCSVEERKNCRALGRGKPGTIKHYATHRGSQHRRCAGAQPPC